MRCLTSSALMPARCPAAVLSHPSLAASLSLRRGQGCFPRALLPAWRPQNPTSQVTTAQIHHGDLGLLPGSLPQLHQSFSRREVPFPGVQVYKCTQLSLVYKCPVHKNFKKADAWLSVLESSDCTPGSPALSRSWYRPSDRYIHAKSLRNSRSGERNRGVHMDPPGYPAVELVLSKVPEETQDLCSPTQSPFLRLLAAQSSTNVTALTARLCLRGMRAVPDVAEAALLGCRNTCHLLQPRASQSLFISIPRCAYGGTVSRRPAARSARLAG